jgi:hypothetical protein
MQQTPILLQQNMLNKIQKILRKKQRAMDFVLRCRCIEERAHYISYAH